MANETIIRAIENAQKRTDVPRFRGGDTVRVYAKVIEGGKERIQIFEGVALARRGRYSETLLSGECFSGEL